MKKNIYSFAAIAAKALEIIHWIAAGLCIVVLIGVIAGGSSFIEGTVLENVFKTGIVYDEATDTHITHHVNIYGLEIAGTHQYESINVHSFSGGDITTGEFFSHAKVTYQNGTYHFGAVIVLTIGTALIMVITALACSRMHLILKSALKATPFRKDMVQHTKELGIFLLDIVVVCIAASFIAGLVSGTGHLDLNLPCMAAGFFVLSLSKSFDYGVKLEQDNEGLI